MNSCFLLFALLAVASCESESGLPGHLKPLGSHQKPIGGIPVTGKFPSPWVFHQEFVKNGQPLVMKKVLETDNIPAYRLWTDQYLRLSNNRSMMGMWGVVVFHQFYIAVFMLTHILHFLRTRKTNEVRFDHQ